jgi:outer membrane protein assembly factor BamB
LIEPLAAHAQQGREIRLRQGGSFTNIGGQARNYIAALDATTGNATAWNPNASYSVLGLALSGTKMFAGGGFHTIGGQTRPNLASLDLTTGNAMAWNPSIGGTVSVLAISGNTLYVGGQFTNSVVTRRRDERFGRVVALSMEQTPRQEMTVE